jgi:hypothetical protein
MYVLRLIIEFASNFEFFCVKNTTKFSNKIAKVCSEVCIGEILSLLGLLYIIGYVLKIYLNICNVISQIFVKVWQQIM